MAESQERRLELLLERFKADSGRYRDLQVPGDTKSRRGALRGLLRGAPRGAVRGRLFGQTRIKLRFYQKPLVNTEKMFV